MNEAAGRYRITRLIQRGGMAEVFEAEILGEGGFSREVAIKRLLPEYTGDPELVSAFVTEARLVSQLQHVNLVSVLDFGTMDGLPFQVLELVRGPDLDRLEARARELDLKPPVELWLAIVSEAAQGLDYAHNARDARGRPLDIVHRDVSPANVLVSWDGGVKVTDFGVARSLEAREQTRLGVIKGKLAYMAPEHVAQDALDARADVFALGCLLHRMIAGVTPLETEAARARFVSGARAELAASIPSDVAKLLQRALDPDRSRRTASARDLALEATRLLQTRGVADLRAVIREWTTRLKPKDTRGSLGALGELMNLDLVLTGSPDEPVRRFASRFHAQTRDQRATTGPSGTKTPSASTPPAKDPLIGQIFGEYELLELIGKGGFARVYRARHAVFNTDFAFKVLLESFKESPAAQRRFQRETIALHAVSHPNLVAIEDSGVLSDGRPYIVMELVRGMTLREALAAAGGPFEATRARRLARQIAQAMHEAHRQGFVHRDLKPKNIVLAKTLSGEQCKVLDFGLALLLDPKSELTRLTAAGHQLGTARWMAPEQVINPAEVGPPADLYCLGLILYAMTVGHPPFSGTPDEVMRKHRDVMPEIPSGPFAPLIRALLQKDPQARPTSAEVIAALDALDLGPEAAPELEPTRAAEEPETKLSEDPGATRPLAARPRVEATAQASAIAGERSSALRAARNIAALAVAAGLGFAAASLRNDREVPVVVASSPDPSPASGPDAKPEPIAVAAPLPVAVAASPEPNATPTTTPPERASSPRPSAERRASDGEVARAQRAELEQARASWDARIKAALEAKRLQRPDLDLSSATRGLRAAYTGARDAPAIARSGAALVAGIERFEIERVELDAQIARIREVLKLAMERRSIDEVRPYDQRLVAARAALSSAKDPLELARELSALEREVRALAP